MLASLQQQQQSQDILAVQQDAQQQSASLMARYGTRLALAGTSSTGSPLAALMSGGGRSGMGGALYGR